MTANAPLLRFLPFLIFGGLVLVSILLDFNGLYGQDAHEYLRQSKAIFALWSFGVVSPAAIGDTEFASGYPVAGALVRYIVGNPIVAMQVVSWVSFVASAWLLERILFVLTHGSRPDSRWVFVGLALVLSPIFVRAGLTVMSDALGLALSLAAFLFSLRWIEHERGSDTFWAAVFIALAVSVRVGLGGMMIPLALIVAWYLVERGRWAWLAATLLAGTLVLLFHGGLKSDVLEQPFQHSLMQHWSPAHFFQRSFQNDNGFSKYLLPNALYLAFPLMHPGFCLILPGLLMLAKKTDLALPAKKVILICLATYLLLIGGLPHQNLRYLLPAYAILLLLFFPAWDRLYSYGFYFFKRFTWGILGVTFLVQIICISWLLSPTVARNHLERTVAGEIRSALPQGSAVYGFDLDIAMRSYLPEIQVFNLWERRYENFPLGSVVLFNAPLLQAQWEGQNPMLNWDFLQENYALETVKNLPEGWTLYAVGKRR